MPAAEMPMPCWPRDIFRRWNFEPYSRRPKMFSTCLRTMPGPLSTMVTRYRELFAVAGRFGSRSSMMTAMSGMMPASSHASSELSTASFTVVRSALRALSKPRRWRFFTKNSLTETSFCRDDISSAVAPRRCLVPPCDDRSFTALSIVWTPGVPSPLSTRHYPNRARCDATARIPQDFDQVREFALHSPPFNRTPT